MEQTNQPPTNQVNLPNASTVLILGILSIVLCWCHGIIGIIMAIAALVLANRDLALYNADPGRYTQSSYSNLRSGRTVALLGLILAVVFLGILLISLVFLGLNFALFPWEILNEIH